MNYRNNASGQQILKRFGWLKNTNLEDSMVEVEGARQFFQAYIDCDGDPHDSMQAALDTKTPYAQDLGLRLLTEILSGNVT
jgi:hypothetical protein